MKTFKIENSAKNINWVNENLTKQDFKIEGNEIVIIYFEEMQKNDILEAIENIEQEVNTLDTLEQEHYVYYNGAQGLSGAIANNQFAPTYEDAVRLMANRDGVSEDSVINNYEDWYYILSVSEIERE